MDELAETVGVISKDYLAVLVRAALKQEPARDVNLHTCGLAGNALAFFLGMQWVRENVLPIEKTRNHHGREFLKTDSKMEDINNRYVFQQRVTELAESLFNMQRVSGFKERLAKMKTEVLESTVGEMESAAIFAAPEFKLRFVTPTSHRGQDYEAEITCPSGQVLCLEMKTKIETKAVTANALLQAIDTARKQLPKGRPCVVFLKLRDIAAPDPLLDAAMRECVESAFRNSERIVGVIFAYHEWCKDLQGGKIIHLQCVAKLNRRSPLFTPEIGNVLALKRNPHWTSFHSVVESVLNQEVTIASLAPASQARA